MSNKQQWRQQKVNSIKVKKIKEKEQTLKKYIRVTTAAIKQLPKQSKWIAKRKPKTGPHALQENQKQ